MKSGDSTERTGMGGQWKRAVAHVRDHRTAYGLVAVLLLLTDGIVFLALAPARPVPPVKAPVTVVPVRTLTVARRAVRETVLYPARIEAMHDVVLAVEREGRIATLAADRGDRIRAGQVLLELDNRAFAAALQKAEIQSRQAADDLKRWEELHKSGAVSLTEYEAVRNRHDLARLAVDEARVELEKGRILSPIDGEVEDRSVDVGEASSPGKPAFHVVNSDTVKVVVDVSERDVFALRPGLAVPFQVDAPEGRSFTGTVSFVASVADPRSNTFRAEIQAGNAERRLKPGAIARVTITRGILDEALAVPLSALIPEKGQYVAYLARDGHAVRRLVTLETIIGEMAVVREGLAPGDRIVTEGQRLVADGAAIAERP